MSSFKALRVQSPQTQGRIEEIPLSPIGPGEVLIKSEYSGVNFKDALAGTNKGRILKSFPLIPGIDVAGKVIESNSKKFKIGDSVLITGCGLGEDRDGGFSEIVKAPEDIVVKSPQGMSQKEFVLLGTAGFTAALSLHRMEQNGQSPKMGPILVTGASGGVGSFAVQIFSQKGYEVVAVTGKEKSVDYLKNLGASKVILEKDLELSTRPLEKARYAGLVDNVGGSVLSGLLPQIQLWGNVSSIGLAAGSELNISVMPMILRGVSILGVSSNNCAKDLRLALWDKLANSWRPKHLAEVLNKEISLNELPQAFEDLLSRRIQGRILLKLN